MMEGIIKGLEKKTLAYFEPSTEIARASFSRFNPFIFLLL